MSEQVHQTRKTRMLFTKDWLLRTHKRHVSIEPPKIQWLKEPHKSRTNVVHTKVSTKDTLIERVSQKSHKSRTKVARKSQESLVKDATYTQYTFKHTEHSPNALQRYTSNTHLHKYLPLTSNSQKTNTIRKGYRNLLKRLLTRFPYLLCTHFAPPVTRTHLPSGCVRF